MADKYNNLPNIDRALGIQIEQSGDTCRADARKLPGTPVVGIGRSEYEARYDLLVNLIYLLATKDARGGYGLIIEDLLKKDWEEHT